MLAAVALQPGAWDPTEGVLDDVHLSDLAIQNVSTPFHFALKGNNTVGSIEVRKVQARNVYRAPCTIESWNAHPFTNVVFSDVTIEFAGGGTEQDARLPIKPPGVDAGKLPIWGFYARNVENLTLENVSIKAQKYLRIGNAKGLVFKNVKVEVEKGDSMLIEDAVEGEGLAKK